MSKKIIKEKAKQVIGETATKTVQFTVKTIIIIFILLSFTQSL